MLDFNDPDPPAPPMIAAVSHALAHAERGWPVFPCNPLTKAPLTDHGFKQATTNPMQIKAWWQRWPQAMIGVPTGEKSGFWVLDIDTDQAKGKDGLGSLAAAGYTLSDVTDTAVSRTGSGGYHCLFQWAKGGPTNARGSLPRHIDVRGEGGYIVAAGSQLADGREYAWLNPPDEIEIAEAPEWLTAMIGQGLVGDPLDFNTAPKSVTPSARVAAIEPGTWHENTRDFIARMVREGASDETIAALAPRFTEPGYSVAQTRQELLTHARTARQKWGYKASVISAEPGPGDTFRILTIDELIDIEPPEWRIDGIFPCHGSSTIYGAYETFKTFAALSLTLSLATGRPWFGRTVKPCPILYIAGEGQTGLGLRVAGWFAAQGIDHRDVPFMGLPEAIAIPNPGDQDKLLRTIDGFTDKFGNPPGVVVMDTVTRMTGGGSLNDEKDAQAYVRGSDRLRSATGAHMMHLGHAGKDKERGIMGSTVLPAAMETIICIERKGDGLTLINNNPKGKQKDGPNFEDIRLTKTVVEFDHRGKRQTTVLLMPDEEVVKPAEDPRSVAPSGGNQKAVMDALAKAKGEPLGLLRISMMIEKDKGTAAAVLSKLTEKGLVECVGEEGAKRWKLT